MSSCSGGMIVLVVYSLMLAPELARADCVRHPRRSSTARAQFQRIHACPVRGVPSIPCKGFIVDHIVPLCAGGADTPDNMQYQPRAEAALKDHWERVLCQQLCKEPQ